MVRSIIVVYGESIVMGMEYRPSFRQYLWSGYWWGAPVTVWVVEVELDASSWSPGVLLDIVLPVPWPFGSWFREFSIFWAIRCNKSFVTRNPKFAITPQWSEIARSSPGENSWAWRLAAALLTCVPASRRRNVVIFTTYRPAIHGRGTLGSLQACFIAFCNCCSVYLGIIAKSTIGYKLEM